MNNVLDKIHLKRLYHAFRMGRQHKQNGLGYSNYFQNKWHRDAYINGYGYKINGKKN